MRTKETRQYEMFVRVRDFREAHRDLFPKKREGGQAFATVAAAVTQLTAYDDSKSKTSEEGKEAKAIARQALFDEIKSISRTAHVIARKSPGFGDLFKMPKSSRPTDQAVLGAGRVFADNAKSVRDRFLAHGMPETFVADLKRLVEMFGEAIRERQTGKERQAVAHRGLATALASGLDAVRALDIIVANVVRDDADALAAWEHDRKVEIPRRSKGRTAAPASTSVVPATSTAVSTPSAPAATPGASQGQTRSDPGFPG